MGAGKTKPEDLLINDIFYTTGRDQNKIPYYIGIYDDISPAIRFIIDED